MEKNTFFRWTKQTVIIIIIALTIGLNVCEADNAATEPQTEGPIRELYFRTLVLEQELRAMRQKNDALERQLQEKQQLLLEQEKVLQNLYSIVGMVLTNPLGDQEKTWIAVQSEFIQRLTRVHQLTKDALIFLNFLKTTENNLGPQGGTTPEWRLGLFNFIEQRLTESVILTDFNRGESKNSNFLDHAQIIGVEKSEAWVIIKGGFMDGIVELSQWIVEESENRGEIIEILYSQPYISVGVVKKGNLANLKPGMKLVRYTKRKSN